MKRTHQKLFRTEILSGEGEPYLQGKKKNKKKK